MKVPVGVLERKTIHEYRRAFSEVKLSEAMPRDLDPSKTYHVMTGGNVDSLSFLKLVLQERLEYCLLSTWCMADDDVEQLRIWVESKRILRLDAYVGEIFPGSYSQQHAGLKKVVDLCGGRVCVFRNHAKVFAGIGDKYAFGIASSANINTNPRTENTVLTFGLDVSQFYKTYFDGVKSYNRDYDAWKPWTPEATA
jgi:hypothetical protein